MLAGIALCIGWTASGRFSLGSELARRCLKHNDLKLTARRGAWYLRRSWVGLDVLPDEYFDPTEGLRDNELHAMSQFIKRRETKIAPLTEAADQAFIAARRLDNNANPNNRAINIAAFKAACDKLLDQTCTSEHNPTLPTAPRTGDFPITDAKQTLSDFMDLFPVSTLRWFFVSGTFLGLIREKGFLSHDYDIDLGVFEDEIDIPTVITAITQSDHFVLKKYDHHQSSLFQPDVVSGNPDIPYILKIVHVSGIHIDLFIHYRDMRSDPPSYWHGSSLHRWNNSAFTLIPYTFYDHEVLGPANADAYLTENYGDWRTPVTEFNCTTDTPNLVLVPHPIAVVIFLKRYVIARSQNRQNATQLEAELIHNGFLKSEAEGQLSFSGELFRN